MSSRYGQQISSSRLTHPASLAIIGFAVGAIAWSGHTFTLPVSLVLMAFLMPAGTLQKRWILAMAYYAGATWPIVPGSAIFYGHDYNPFAMVPLWLAVAFFLAAPWALLCGNSIPRMAWAVPACLIIESIPPFATLGLANPIVAAGAMLPYTHWYGIALTLLLATLVAVRPVPSLILVTVLACLAYYAPAPPPPSGWTAISTEYHGEGLDAPDPLRMYRVAQDIQRQALVSNAQVVIFPESIVYRWNDATDLFWQRTIQQLRREGKTLIVGANMDLPGNRQYLNVAVIRGATPDATFEERIPMPVSMWKPGSGQGVPLNLSGPGTVRIGQHRAAILVCYEELLVWPVVRSLAERPTVLIGMANDYWARGTYFPAIQTASIEAWGKLFDIPVLTAVNQ